MPNPRISQQFILLLKATRAPDPSDIIQARIDAIRARIQRDFDVKKFGFWGSHAKGTAVRSVSDIDMFCLMSRAEARKWSPDGSSASLIRRLRNEVQNRYGSTSVRRDDQAVVIGFSDGTSLDLIPAVFDSFSGMPQYRIPDGGGGWITTSPDAQKRRLIQADNENGNRLRPLIRLLKYWASVRTGTANLRSYYIECAAMNWRLPVGYSHQQALASAFTTLLKRKLADVDDPIVDDESVRSCHTSNQRQSTEAVLETVSGRATKALEAENDGDCEEAIRQWRLIFNNAFLTA